MGMIVSQATNPCHRGCVNCVSTASPIETDTQAAAAIASSRPPISQNIVNPRKASKESNRCEGGADVGGGLMYLPGRQLYARE